MFSAERKLEFTYYELDYCTKLGTKFNINISNIIKTKNLHLISHLRTPH